MNPRLRSVALGMLLLVLPFSGIRVICVESSAVQDEPAAADTQAAAEERPLTDCERLCPYHPPASVQGLHADAAAPASDEESDCALSSDAAALQMLGTIAVLRSAEPLTVPYVVSDAPVYSTPFYAEPALIHLGPPPKARSL